MDGFLLFAIVAAIVTGLGYLFYPTPWASQFEQTFPSAITRIAWGQVLFFGFQLVRLFRLWLGVYRDVQNGSVWVDWFRPPWPAFFKFVVQIVITIVVMLLFSFSFFDAKPLGVDIKAIWSIFVLASLTGFAFYAQALRVIDEVEAIIKRGHSYHNGELGTSQRPHNEKRLSARSNKVARFREAFQLLGGSFPRYRQGPAPLLSVFKRLCVIYAGIVWYKGQELWLHFTLINVLQNPTQSAFFMLLVYTSAFILLIFVSWLLGLRLTPVYPSMLNILFVFIGLLVFSIIFAGVLVYLANPDQFAPVTGRQILSTGVAGTIIIVSAIVGGLTWCQIQLTSNPALARLPKELQFRFWVGAAEMAGLVVIGFQNDSIEGIIAFVGGILLMGLISRPFGTLIGVITGLIFTALINRLNLVIALSTFIGTEAASQMSKVGVVILASALIGATCAVLIGLANPPRSLSEGK